MTSHSYIFWWTFCLNFPRRQISSIISSTNMRHVAVRNTLQKQLRHEGDTRRCDIYLSTVASLTPNAAILANLHYYHVPGWPRRTKILRMIQSLDDMDEAVVEYLEYRRFGNTLDCLRSEIRQSRLRRYLSRRVRYGLNILYRIDSSLVSAENMVLDAVTDRY